MTQSTKDGVTTTYTYNGDGLRMSKTTNGVTTSFILDGADVVAEIKGNEITIYSRGLGLISQTKGDTTKTYFSDDHGNITSLHSADADSEEALYDGFGNTLFNDSSGNPFGYCGEYYDEETGLIYLRARYYDPEIGRFISEDPHWNTDNMIYGNKESKNPDSNAIKQSNNLYVYCMNNPILFIDSNGTDGKVVYIGKGWYYRIDSANTATNTQRHIHIYNNEKCYIQNEDGSPHDKNNNSKGSPPNKVLKAIKEDAHWDYKEKENSFFNNINIVYFDGGKVQITYPNKYQIIKYFSLYEHGIVTKELAKELYYNNIPNRDTINVKVYITPIVVPVTVPVFSPSYVPAFGF